MVLQQSAVEAGIAAPAASAPPPPVLATQVPPSAQLEHDAPPIVAEVD